MPKRDTNAVEEFIASVPKDPKQNVKATEDFLYKVLAGYVAAARGSTYKR